jgi:MFS family permease
MAQAQWRREGAGHDRLIDQIDFTTFTLSRPHRPEGVFRSGQHIWATPFDNTASPKLRHPPEPATDIRSHSMSSEIANHEAHIHESRDMPSRPRNRGAPMLTRRFAILFVAQACFGYAFSSYFLLPKYLVSEFGTGPAAIGQLTAANGFAAVIAMFAMGVLVDRYGRRIFLTGGALLMAATSVGFLFVEGVGPLIYLLRILQGFAFAAAFVGGATLAVDQAPPDRLGQVIGLFGLTMLSMNAVAPVVIEAIASTHGWSLAFSTAALGAGVCAALSRFVYEGPHDQAADGGLRGLIAVALRPDQLRVAFVISLVGACFGSVFVFNQLYALELGITEVRTFFVAYAIAAIITRLAFGHIGDRLGHLRVAAVMLVVYAGGAFAMLALAEVGLAPLGFLFGFAHGVFYPTYNASVVAGRPEHERGKLLALFQGWFNAGLALGSFALGFVADAYGYPTIFLCSGIGILMALAVLLDGMLRGRHNELEGVRVPDPS